MYLLFRYHHILPSQYYEMGFGERAVVGAFMHFEVEKRNEEVARLNDSMRS